MKTQEYICKSCTGQHQNHIGRRAFLSKGAQCTAGLAFLAFPGLINTALAYADNKPGNGVLTGPDDPPKNKNDIKKMFMKKGTCSTTFFFLVNREFGHLKEKEEYAASPLAGGILERGYQCGMLWGASLAIGAESFRRNMTERDQATAKAITATQHIIESFSKQTKTMNCRDVTNIDLTKPFSKLKMILTSAGDCMKLAEKWGPKSFKAAREGLNYQPTGISDHTLSCATETAIKMGATEEESLMVAGFAGGLGLSGNACGALAAAVWMNALCWLRENPNKKYYPNKNADVLFSVFNDVTGSEILCSKIAGQHFKTIHEHTQYIKNGGCATLISLLAETGASS